MELIQHLLVLVLAHWWHVLVVVMEVATRIITQELEGLAVVVLLSTVTLVVLEIRGDTHL
jgi:hypothetical protein